MSISLLDQKHFARIAKELSLAERDVAMTVLLLDDGATVPFIARYRKEATGSLNEVQIAQIRDRLAQLRELEKRRETVLNSITEQGKLTDELREQILAADTMSALEDLYLPYRPKRRTRATAAREKGLEPLADKLFAQEDFDIEAYAAQFVDEDKEVKDIEEALAGARDIIAERVNEDANARASVRKLFVDTGHFTAKVITGKEELGAKYKDYFDWSEPIKDAPSHRVLALRRAEKEGIISLDLAPEEEQALDKLNAMFIKTHNATATHLQMAIKDAYKRLMKPSIETEVRLLTKERADAEAIKVFADNLRQLLLASPLGTRRVLAIDPGIRTGCKVVALDENGKLLAHEVIYPDRRRTEAGTLIMEWCTEYKIEAISIGNGTASRETENFVRSLPLPKSIIILVVNESGASVYSASEAAREEFPDHDITVRGAVSIGRRLQDPLAELVKIDPKSIGVGQYQHDVDEVALKASLDDVVVSAVNAVGVEVNTASKQLLTYVSGLGPTLAKNIIDYRDRYGAFMARTELKRVARLGEKAFEQCAGFLRIRDAENPLDASAVHPERYPIVEQMAADLGCAVIDLMKNAELRKQIDLKKYVNESEGVGLPTLQDILHELAKPGRDPREKFEIVEFAEGINKIEDLQVGMKLTGIVTNITNFGVFVDVGVHQDGLVHISQLSNKFVSNPQEVVKVQQKVQVTVTEVDIARRRISLSMRDEIDTKPATRKADKAPKTESKPQKAEQGKLRADKFNQKYKKPDQPQSDKKPTQKPQAKAKNESAEMSEDDFAAKLAALRSKFGK